MTVGIERTKDHPDPYDKFITFRGLVGSTLAALEDFTPAQPHVAEYSHSAKIKIDPKDVPDGTNMIHIEAKEINDLTGDRFEAGYEFGYK